MRICFVICPSVSCCYSHVFCKLCKFVKAELVELKWKVLLLLTKELHFPSRWVNCSSATQEFSLIFYPTIHDYARKGKGKVHPRTGPRRPRGEQIYSSTLSLTSALDGVGGQRHASAALPPGERPGTHCIGGLMGPRAGLDRCGKSRPHQDSIPGPSSP